MRKGPGKERTRPMAQEDEAVARRELRGIPGEENPEAADGVHIPDYVMRDFGFPEKTRSGG